MAQRTLTHVQRVTRLYRNCLRHSLSWIVVRENWRRQALEIRYRFDMNKNINNPILARQLLEEGERELNENRHPDPYVHPLSPGGSKYERNIPPPPHILKLTPEEEKWVEEMSKW